MKKKLLIVVPLLALLILGGAGYKFAFADKKKDKEPKPKVEGKIYILGKQFTVNLKDASYATFTVALVLDAHDTSDAPPEAGGHGAAPAPPEGFGPMPQEALIRAIITEEVTGVSDQDLLDKHHREEIKEHILKAIKKKTDVHAEEILLTDLAVQ
ncbi:MAG: flagellar basal body-associated FliL family protein [Actinomycetota bacterium]|nr:flagellar basal body-associated FliL family protein [Actinomycetota bacterium]